jgi:RHO1 GDP-GTP exchange protein 1/2
MGGLLTLFAESAQAREEWHKKLEEAVVLRKVVQESNKVFELETLSADTFLVPSIHANGVGPAWSDEHTFTGKVTCSVPFCKFAVPDRSLLRGTTYSTFLLSATADGRGLVAIGCAEGVWIGLRHDSRCGCLSLAVLHGH